MRSIFLSSPFFCFLRNSSFSFDMGDRMSPAMPDRFCRTARFRFPAKRVEHPNIMVLSFFSTHFLLLPFFIDRSTKKGPPQQQRYAFFEFPDRGSRDLPRCLTVVFPRFARGTKIHNVVRSSSSSRRERRERENFLVLFSRSELVTSREREKKQRDHPTHISFFFLRIGLPPRIRRSVASSFIIILFAFSRHSLSVSTRIPRSSSSPSSSHTQQQA